MSPAGDRRVLGAVLAGGASSRFGSDKALARIGDTTLLDLARETLAPFVDSVIVVGRKGGVLDRPVAGLGPLGGIAGALAAGADKGFASVLTIGCDMPQVPPALLHDVSGCAPSYCADAPILGHWPTALAEALLTSLAETSPAASGKQSNLSVRRWAASIGARAIPAATGLRNVNTPADLPTG